MRRVFHWLQDNSYELINDYGFEVITLVIIGALLWSLWVMVHFMHHCGG